MRKTLLMTLAALGSISLVSACSSADASTKAPESLVGNWHQTNAKSDTTMEAEISASSIQIRLKTRDTSGMYWLGSFDGTKDTSKPFKLVSKADQDALSMSIFASRSADKTFTYKDGELSYEFTILGTTSTVELEKTEEAAAVPQGDVAVVPEVDIDIPDAKKLKVVVPAPPAPKAPPVKTTK